MVVFAQPGTEYKPPVDKNTKLSIAVLAGGLPGGKRFFSW